MGSSENKHWHQHKIIDSYAFVSAYVSPIFTGHMHCLRYASAYVYAYVTTESRLYKLCSHNIIFIYPCLGRAHVSVAFFLNPLFYKQFFACIGDAILLKKLH